MGCCGKKIKNVVTGYVNLLTQKPPTSEVKRRLTICRNCSSNRWKGLRMFCQECHCYIPAKVRVPEEKCRLGRW